MSNRTIQRQPTFADKEPIWSAVTPSKQVDVIQALNWYNRERDEKDAAKYLDVPLTIARDFCTLAWATRLKTRGYVFTGKALETISMMEANLAEAVKTRIDTVAESGNVISIQARVQAKSEIIIGEMNGLIDEFGILGNAKDMNAYQWMVDNDIKSVHAARIIEYFRNHSKEPFAAMEAYLNPTEKNKYLRESYAKFSKVRLMNLLNAYANIIKDAERLAQQTKTARKPRKKKQITHEKKVSKLKYAARNDSLKLQSVDPVRIIGAEQLWVYNVKTRKLGVYHAIDLSGLSVKGSTIKNYSEDASISKTLRKPEKTLALVTNSGKVALRKTLDSLSSKPIKLRGRINKDTLLVRII